jgi:hypothetical protein
MIGASIGIMMELGVGIVIIFEILLRKSIDGGSAVLSFLILVFPQNQNAALCLPYRDLILILVGNPLSNYF